MKLVVFGNSDSGKSTYARAVAIREGLAHLDLDSIVWEPGKIAVQRSPDLVSVSLQSFIDSHPAWVIEGCYGELVREASAHCTLLVFLNRRSMRVWQTISDGPRSHISTLRSNFKTPCLISFKNGWPNYYQRTDAWSYRVHREIFDAFTGPKVEHRELGAYAA